MPPRPRLLVVAGHDPSGGAGVHADIEAAAARGVATCTLITALTVQTSSCALRVEPVDIALLQEACAALRSEFSFDGIKFGLLPTRAAVEFAQEICASMPAAVKVADPVLVAGGGGTLTSDEVPAALLSLLPHLTLITPNRDELQALTGTDDVKQGAEVLQRAGVPWVLVTGADRDVQKAKVVHWLSGADGIQKIEVERLPGHFHGSGCTLAAAVAAEMSKGVPVPQAASIALSYCVDSLSSGDCGLPWRIHAPAEG